MALQDRLDLPPCELEAVMEKRDAQVYEAAHSYGMERQPLSGLPLASVSEFSSWYTVNRGDEFDALTYQALADGWSTWRDYKLARLRGNPLDDGPRAA
jgi:hypothetical protein